VYTLFLPFVLRYCILNAVIVFILNHTILFVNITFHNGWRPFKRILVRKALTLNDFSRNLAGDLLFLQDKLDMFRCNKPSFF